jgi:hypothetical protein
MSSGMGAEVHLEVLEAHPMFWFKKVFKDYQSRHYERASPHMGLDLYMRREQPAKE